MIQTIETPYKTTYCALPPLARRAEPSRLNHVARLRYPFRETASNKAFKASHRSKPRHAYLTTTYLRLTIRLITLLSIRPRMHSRTVFPCSILNLTPLFQCCRNVGQINYTLQRYYSSFNTRWFLFTYIHPWSRPLLSTIYFLYLSPDSSLNTFKSISISR